MSKIESLAAVIAEQKTRIDAQSRVITELRAANRIISEESTELMVENGRLRAEIDRIKADVLRVHREWFTGSHNSRDGFKKALGIIK